MQRNESGPQRKDTPVLLRRFSVVVAALLMWSVAAPAWAAGMRGGMAVTDPARRGSPAAAGGGGGGGGRGAPPAPAAPLTVSRPQPWAWRTGVGTHDGGRPVFHDETTGLRVQETTHVRNERSWRPLSFGRMRRITQTQTETTVPDGRGGEVTVGDNWSSTTATRQRFGLGERVVTSERYGGQNPDGDHRQYDERTGPG